jgi:hypothetical protein
LPKKMELAHLQIEISKAGQQARVAFIVTIIGIFLLLASFFIPTELDVKILSVCLAAVGGVAYLYYTNRRNRLMRKLEELPTPRHSNAPKKTKKRARTSR